MPLSCLRLDGAKMPRPICLVSRTLLSLVALLPGCGDGSSTARPDSPVIVTASQKQPSSASPIVTPIPAPNVAEPSPSEPVKAALACRLASLSPGTTGELLVAVRIAGAHYLHAEADHDGTFRPLEIEATLPTGVEFIGNWIFPAPETGRGGVPIYRNSVLLRRMLKITSAPPTPDVTGVLRYQACNDELCWPPGKLELSVSLPTQAEAIR